MLQDDLKTIRVLGIISLILSILAAVGAIILVGLIALGMGLLGSPEFSTLLVQSLNNDPETVRELASIGLSAESIPQIISSFLVVPIVLFAIYVLCTIPCIIASVHGIKAVKQPSKANVIMGWSIAAAVLALLGGRLISLAIFIVMAVYANKVKKNAFAPANITQQAAPLAPSFADAPQQAASAPFANAPQQTATPATSASPAPAASASPAPAASQSSQQASAPVAYASPATASQPSQQASAPVAYASPATASQPSQPSE